MSWCNVMMEQLIYIDSQVHESMVRGQFQGAMIEVHRARYNVISDGTDRCHRISSITRGGVGREGLQIVANINYH